MSSASALFDVHAQRRQHLAAAAAIALALATLLAVYAVAGPTKLTIVVPVVAATVGVGLFLISGPAYVEFMLWVWFLAPLIRRLVDFAQGAYTPTSLIIASPILVAAVALLPLFLSIVRGRVSITSPFVIPLSAIAFAYVIGLARNGSTAATYDLLSWAVPIAVGYVIAQDWQNYPTYRRSVQRAFAVGAVVLGLYGVLQFLVVPGWDRLWMVSAEMNSIGHPEPFQVRVFGPLNSPGPYAMAMMAAVIVLTAGRNVVSIASGAIGLLLSLVRSSWGGLLVAIAWGAWRSSGRERARLLAIIVAGLLLAIPLLALDPFQTTVVGRAETLSAMESDTSFRDRTSLYSGHGPRWVLQNPLGRGLGSLGTVAQLSSEGTVSFDSGLLAVPLALGIPGMLIYYLGLGMLLLKYVCRAQPDRFLTAVSGLVLAILAQLLFANQLTDLSGTLLWMCLGLLAAGNPYYLKNEGGTGTS